MNRPQEVVAALQQLQQAYINYYTSTNDYNRAQFRLFRAMGYPAQRLACGKDLGTRHAGGHVPPAADGPGPRPGAVPELPALTVPGCGRAAGPIRWVPLFSLRGPAAHWLREAVSSCHPLAPRIVAPCALEIWADLNAAATSAADAKR